MVFSIGFKNTSEKALLYQSLKAEETSQKGWDNMRLGGACSETLTCRHTMAICVVDLIASMVILRKPAQYWPHHRNHRPAWVCVGSSCIHMASSLVVFLGILNVRMSGPLFLGPSLGLLPSVCFVQFQCVTCCFYFILLVSLSNLFVCSFFLMRERLRSGTR